MIETRKMLFSISPLEAEGHRLSPLKRGQDILIMSESLYPGSRRPRALPVDECVPTLDGRCRPAGA